MATDARFDLFGFWRSSATYRVRVALRLKGLAADEQLVDLDAGAQRSEAFLARNPLGAVPALLDRQGASPSAVLTQSLAILEYLDEVAPTPPLLPANPWGRARVRSLALMMAADTHPLIVPRVKRMLQTTGGFDDAAWRAWQVQWFTAGLRAFEARLASDGLAGRFCHGDIVSMADICLASIVAVMRVFAIEVSGVPTVTRIVATCDAMDAFAQSDPRRQAGAPAAA